MKFIVAMLAFSTIVIGIFVWREFAQSDLVHLGDEDDLSDQVLKWIGVGTAAVNLLILAKNGLIPNNTQ